MYMLIMSTLTILHRQVDLSIPFPGVFGEFCVSNAGSDHFCFICWRSHVVCDAVAIRAFARFIWVVPVVGRLVWSLSYAPAR